MALEELTKKQKGFVKDYIETGNGTLAAMNNYDIKSSEPERVAAAIASENLTKPNIIAYLESKAEKASEMVFILSQTAENEAVRLSASKDILDRAGFEPVKRTINLDVRADITDPKARELAKEYEEKLKEGL